MIGRKLSDELASSDRITDVASQISQHLLASPRGDLHPSVDGRVLSLILWLGSAAD